MAVSYTHLGGYEAEKGYAWTGRFQDRKSGLSALRFDRSKLSGQCYGDVYKRQVQNRGGKGVKCYKSTEKTGNVVGAKAVNEENEIMMITTEGIIIRLQLSLIHI